MTARQTGSKVTAARTATKGINMPPKPTLRRNGTGSTTSDSSPAAAVNPLSITALPAFSAADTTASSLLRPFSRSSRHRTTTMSEKSIPIPRLNSTTMYSTK